MGKCDWTMAEARAWVNEHKDYQPDEAETKEAPDVQALFDHLNERMDTLMQTMEMLKPLLTPAPVAAPINDEIVIDPPAQVIDIDPTPAPKAAPKSDELTMDEIESAITSGVAKLDLSKVLPETIALALDKLRGRVR